MTAPWKKAARDFWQERTRTLLVAAAIALGIAAFLAVLSSYAILTRELNAGYLATNPASATLRMDEVNDAVLRSVLADPRIANAEARRSLMGRLKSGPAEWRNLQLFVVKDFGQIRISKLNPEHGAWPPAQGEILIERDALQVAKARIGDRVSVKTTNGNEATLLVSGSVHDVGQAQARMENIVYGYITVDTLPLLGERPQLDQLQILVAQDPFNEEHIRAVAAGVQKKLESEGHSVRRVDTPPPGKHPHASIMGLLLLSMSSFGIFVLVLSGVLVINLLTAILASQVRQIGVLKTVGGTRAQVAKIYFAQTFLLGCAATALALPLGILAGRALCRYMAVFLNFDITSFAVPLWVYALVCLVGVVAPLLAAAYPILRGTRIPVREALAEYGVSPEFGSGRMARLLASLAGSRATARYAVRNCFRRRTRMVLTVSTLAVSGLFFMSALNLRTSMISTLDALFATKRYDLQVGMGTMVPMEKIARALNRTPGIRRSEGWLVTEGAVARATDGNSAATATTMHAAGGGGMHGGGALPSGRFPIIALPAGSGFVRPNIIAGRNLQAGDVDAMLVNSAVAAANPQVKVGASIPVQMGPGVVNWKVVGIAREPFSPATAYVPLAFFERMGHAGMVNSVRLQLDDPSAASIARVKANLDQALREEGIRALNGMSKADSRFGFDQHMLMIYVFLVIMSCIVAGVGGLGLTTTMSLNVLERRREMGVLRTVGAVPRTVGSIVVIEGTALALLSWIVGAAGAWPLSRGIGNLITRAMFQSGLDFAFDLRGPAIWLLVCLSLGIVASLLPAWHAGQRSVREAIANE